MAKLLQIWEFWESLDCVYSGLHSFLGKMVKILFSKLKKLEYKNWAQICSKVKHKKLYLVNLRSDEPLTKSCLLLSLLPLPFSNSRYYHDTTPVRCILCKEVLANYLAMKAHVKQEHPDLKMTKSRVKSLSIVLGNEEVKTPTGPQAEESPDLT